MVHTIMLIYIYSYLFKALNICQLNLLKLVLHYCKSDCHNCTVSSGSCASNSGSNNTIISKGH